MDITLSQQPTSTQVQQTHLWLVTANRLLVASSDELHTLLQGEVASNPALELEERLICPACGRALQGSACPSCPALTSTTSSRADQSFVDHDENWLPPRAEAAEEWDYLAQYATPVGFREALMQALRTELPAEAGSIIEYLVGNLDDDGYLRCTLEEAASVLQVSQAKVEQVLKHLQAQEPGGIGARSLRECLLLQLQALEAEGRGQPHAAEIVDRFLEPLAQRQYTLIGRELGISRQQVERVRDFLKQRLTPFPTRYYDQSGRGGALDTVIPQVIIRCQATDQGNHYTVEVVEAERFYLRVNPVYLEAYQEMRRWPDSFGAADHAHLQQYVGHARLLVASLRKRWQTLGRITQYLIEQQQAFLEQGNAALRPLTRAQVAEGLGVHASTVSRAVSDKFVRLPNEQVVPLSVFFEANLPVKEALKDILAQEKKPLSDQRLSEVLAARGIQVARRTLAKYRAELRVPASSAR